MTDVGNQLRDAIRGSGLSLSQLAKAARVDAGRLSRFVRGERDLTLKAAAQFCDVLGLRLCRDESPGPPESSQLPGLPARSRGKPAAPVEGRGWAKMTRQEQEE